MMRDFMQSEYDVFFHFLTLGSLGPSKLDAVLRSWFTLLFTIIYTIILSAILVVCHVDLDMVSLPTALFHGNYIWSDVEIVKEPFFLNVILTSTISLGWIALFLDILSTWCRFKDSLDNENEFWGKTVLLEGLFGCESICRTSFNLMDYCQRATVNLRLLISDWMIFVRARCLRARAQRDHLWLRQQP